MNYSVMNGVRFESDPHSFSSQSLNLILSPFTPTPAKPKTNFLEVPGRDGLLDLTEANGEVKYHSREFLFNFTIAPGDDLTYDERLTAVSNALNGKRFNITLDRDPDYYWVGRCVVNNYSRNKNIGKIQVKATVSPYKLKNGRTTKSYSVSSNTVTTVYLPNGKMPTVPIIDCPSNGVIVGFGGKTYTLKAGGNKIMDFRLREGSNKVTLTGGIGSVYFHYQEGEL